MGPKPVHGNTGKKRPNAVGRDRRNRYPAKMKLKAIHLIENGYEKRREEVERLLYKEFKETVAYSTLSDWWTDREKLKVTLKAGGTEKAVVHTKWQELDDKLLPLLLPLEERGVLTVEIIRKQVCGVAGSYGWSCFF